jgi:hypothetical protein
MGGGGGGSVLVLGVVVGDLVDDAWGNVPCVSKIDTLDFSTRVHSLLKEKTMQARQHGGGGGGVCDEMETYDGPVSRLTSTLCGESATRLGLGTWDWNGVVTVSSTGAKNLLQGDDNGHVGRPCEVYQPFGIVPCVCVGMDTMGRSHCLLYKCEADTVW